MTMQDAQLRFAYAFGELPPSWRPQRLTRTERRRVNRRLTRVYPALVPQRERVQRKLLGALRAHFQSEVRRILDEMENIGAWDEIVDRTVSIYNGQRVIGDSETQQRAKVRRYLREHDEFEQRIVTLLRRASSTSPGHVTGFEETPDILMAARVLLAESGARVVSDSVRALSSETQLRAAIKQLDDLANFTPDDVAVVNLAFPDFPDVTTAGKLSPALRDALTQRQNLITLPQFSDQMFQEIKNTIRNEIIERAKGGVGAETLARQLVRDLRAKYGNALPPGIENRAELWARTEGCVMQNDALMARGRDAKMDGKIWQSVGDQLVRDEHVANESDGVIPIDDAFTDGSTDAGAGSVSPFNCRCVCGPALLDRVTESDLKKLERLTPLEAAARNKIGPPLPKVLPRKRVPKVRDKPLDPRTPPKYTGNIENTVKQAEAEMAELGILDDKTFLALQRGEAVSAKEAEALFAKMRSALVRLNNAELSAEQIEFRAAIRQRIKERSGPLLMNNYGLTQAEANEFVDSYFDLLGHSHYGMSKQDRFYWQLMQYGSLPEEAAISGQALAESRSVLLHPRLAKDHAELRRVFYHENSHHIETKAALGDRNLRWVHDRLLHTKNNTLWDYGGDKLLKEDEFVNAYVGRLYPGQNLSEVLSSGSEMWADVQSMSNAIAKDPEFVRLTWANLRGY